MEAGGGELVADADERPPRVERLGEQVEHRSAALEQVDQRAVRPHLLVPHLLEQAGGAADEDALLRSLALEERRSKHVEERALGRRQAGVGDSRRRSWALPGERPTSWSFRYWAAQFARPGSTGRSNGVHPLGHVARRVDRDHHHDLRLEHQHLDVTDGRGLERRRRDERDQARHPGEHLGRRLERRLDLAARLGQVQREARAAAPPGARAGGRRSSGSRGRSGCARPRCAGG